MKIVDFRFGWAWYPGDGLVWHPDEMVTSEGDHLVPLWDGTKFVWTGKMITPNPPRILKYFHLRAPGFAGPHIFTKYEEMGWMLSLFRLRGFDPIHHGSIKTLIGVVRSLHGEICAGQFAGVDR